MRISALATFLLFIFGLAPMISEGQNLSGIFLEKSKGLEVAGFATDAGVRVFFKQPVPLVSYEICRKNDLQHLELRTTSRNDNGAVFHPEIEVLATEEDAINYNNAAMEVMRGNGIIINDIYSKSISIHRKYCIKINNVHYTNEGYVEISKLILPILGEEIDKVKRSKN